jgi:hypothetical protein
MTPWAILRLGRRGKELDRHAEAAELSRPNAPVQVPARDAFLKGLLVNLTPTKLGRAVIMVMVIFMVYQHYLRSQPP